MECLFLGIVERSVSYCLRGEEGFTDAKLCSLENETKKRRHQKYSHGTLIQHLEELEQSLWKNKTSSWSTGFRTDFRT